MDQDITWYIVGPCLAVVLILIVIGKNMTCVKIRVKWKYSKTCLKKPLKNRQYKGLKDKW